MEIGQIVIAKKGRDKGKFFVVTSLEDGYLYLVDGESRVLRRPKKKKVMHVQQTNTIVDLKVAGRDLQDADIRKAIKVLLHSPG